MPGPRIWRLTPEQYAHTVQSLLGDKTLRPDRELAAILGDKAAPGFANQAGAMDLSEPHVNQLLQIARDLAGRAVASATLFPCQDARAMDRTCLRSFVESFGARAFRRPLATEEVDEYLRFFDAQVPALGGSGAARAVVSALLMSPSFLFRTELGDAGTGGTFSLTAFEKASALSYFLTDGPPDAELWAAARDGALSRPEQVATHAKRLLASSETAAGVMAFLGEHLETHAVASARKDAMLFPVWNTTLATDLATEMELFVKEVLWKEDGRLATLLTGQFSLVNKRVSDLYGADLGVTETTFRRVSLPRTRAGLLTRPGLMATLARENDTDPVIRGKYLREVLLCQEPPPPPEDVNAVPPPPDGKSTQRERLARHSADPTCVGCHQLLDPIGLAFESYDAVGRYRTEDVGQKLDTTGTLTHARPEGARFTDASELAGLLAASPDAGACFVKKAFQYAHGRAPTEADACALDRLGRLFETSRGDIRGLLGAIAGDESFFQRSAAAGEMK